ncbi:PRC-barrel domain-containing protein [Candidatus Pacearchaeota archaeon]|nr:PRC-barrel domain-containing protein [Candidatus Pacearchaeota archaeon]
MIEVLIDKTAPLEKTFNAGSLLGSNVLTPQGLVVGKIKEIRMSPDDMDLEGVIVSRGWLKNKIYIGRNYFKKLSQESLILSIEPAPLLEGRTVINYQGKRIGRVVQAVRADSTNALKHLIVKKTFHKEFIVPVKFVQAIGSTIILKESYDKPDTISRP